MVEGLDSLPRPGNPLHLPIPFDWLPYGGSVLHAAEIAVGYWSCVEYRSFIRNNSIKNDNMYEPYRHSRILNMPEMHDGGWIKYNWFL